MKLAYLFLAVALLALPSCMTAHGPNGEKLTMVMTNSGFVTNQTNDADSNVGGLGSGLFKNNSIKTAQIANSRGPTGIHIGPHGISVNTVIDQSTPIDEAGEWVYRGVRSYFVLEGFRSLFDNFYGTERAEIAADASVEKAGISGATDQARIAAETERARISAESVVENVVEEVAE